MTFKEITIGEGEKIKLPCSCEESYRCRESLKQKVDKFARFGKDLAPVGRLWANRTRKCAIVFLSKVEQESRLPVEVLMLEECLTSEKTAGKALSSFELLAEEPPLPAEKGAEEGRIFLVASFLKELKRLCKRHLRRGFPLREENLRGKIKGRPLLRENMRKNWSRLRYERVYCRFRDHSLDTPENRVLRAALELCVRFLARLRNHFKALNWMATFCRLSLATVPVTKITAQEAARVKVTGVQKHYRTPLRLAVTVLRELGFLWSRGHSSAVTPYLVNMSTLFEAYCEALLRKGRLSLPSLAEVARIETQKLFSWEGENNIKIKPDFLIFDQKGRTFIGDAKYKLLEDRFFRLHDLYQIVAYARHRELQKQYGEVAGAFLFYPASKETRHYEISSFAINSGEEAKIFVIGVPLPENQGDRETK